ncbi:MAG: SH3 domain-containing protein [Caldilineaceae bacterium]|nr:SH3 domain-containing protein [Caldilineaceae bacterium]
MHAQPPRTLKRLIKQYGPELIDDPRRTESLLNDLCGQHRREIFVLVNAQKQRVPAELLAAPAWMPHQATWARLSRRLQDKLALTEDAADWAVAAWAGALDLSPAAAKGRWPWPRPQPAAAAPAASGKHKNKKRQSGQVDVQYRPDTAHKAKRHAARSARAEMKARPFSLIWSYLGGEPVAKLVVWGAILLVSISLLVVVVNAMSRPAAVDETARAAGEAQATAEPDSAGAAPVDPAGAALPSDPDLLASYVTLPRIAWVTEGPLLVRQGPSTGDAHLATLRAKEGVTVDGFSVDGAWSHIAQPNDGWVSNQYLSFLTDDAKEFVLLQVRRETVAAPLVIHQLPNAGSATVTQLQPGDSLVTVAITLDGAWRQTAYPASGWVPTQP